MYAMVAYDAFTQAYTNPLVSKNIFNARTFSDYGLEVIASTTCFNDLVKRNVKTPESMMANFGFSA